MKIARKKGGLIVSFIIISMLLQAFAGVMVFAQPETVNVDDDGVTRTLNSLAERQT